MRFRHGISIAVLAAGGVVTTMLVGLVTNAVTESAPQTEGEPPGAALVLRALPRDTVAFTDRGAELAALVGSARAAQESGEALPVHVTDGMPGGAERRRSPCTPGMCWRSGSRTGSCS